MAFIQNFKAQTGIGRLLTGGLVGLSMLFIIFSISCRAPTTEPAPIPESEPSPTTTPNEVKISSFAFVLTAITVSVGTTVTWVQNDFPPHTVTSREALFDSGNLSRGATFSHTFGQSGTFEYYCKIHPYMTGKIIVE